MSEPTLTVYEKPTCTTCRKLRALLEEEGVDFERVNFFVEPLSEARIRDLLSRADVDPRDALRTRGGIHRKAGLDRPDVTADEIVAAMADDPNLLQRPIVERGERAVVARPVERVRDLFDS
jgi:arsenate reductase